MEWRVAASDECWPVAPWCPVVEEAWSAKREPNCWLRPFTTPTESVEKRMVLALELVASFSIASMYA
jgi:hypothetical protein